MYEMKELLDKRKKLEFELDSCHRSIEESKSKNLVEVLKFAIEAIFGTIPRMVIEDNIVTWSEEYKNSNDKKAIEYYNLELKNIEEVKVTKESIYIRMNDSETEFELVFTEGRVNFFDEIEYMAIQKGNTGGIENEE